jgi:hypothetical protein
MNSRLKATFSLCAFFAVSLGTWQQTLGATISVPNGSFESPAVVFADPRMDEWQKAAEPAWYMGGGGFPWEQVVGQFQNTTNGAVDHIDNMDGNQGSYFFALPDLAIFQSYNTIGGTNVAATHNFDVQFEAGKAYALTVGVIGGGGGMSNGVTMEISLYYEDAATNRVVIAATTVTNSPATFPVNTHFVDFEVDVPTVKVSDAWAGRKLGIRVASTVGFGLMGGYWDLDNVRLQRVTSPALTAPSVTNGHFQFTLQSEPGRFEILRSTNVTLAPTNWTSLTIITNLTGSISFVDTNAISGNRFYLARQLP